MDWMTTLAAAGTIIVSIITLLGSMYGMMKFLLKDVQKEIEIQKENQAEFREYMKAANAKSDALGARLDGIYHLMLAGKYDLARKKLHEKGP